MHPNSHLKKNTTEHNFATVHFVAADEKQELEPA
jgi:hypothetical protein